MRSSKKKLLSYFYHYTDVTCSDGVKKKVDEFLDSQYQIWKQTRNPKKDINGLFTCGNQQNNSLIMDYIRLVYHEYEIPDPLNPEQTQFLNQLTKKKSQTYKGVTSSNLTFNPNGKKIQNQNEYQDHEKTLPKYKQFIKQEQSNSISSSNKKNIISPHIQKALFDSRQTTQQNTTIDRYRQSFTNQQDKTLNLSIDKSQVDKYPNRNSLQEYKDSQMQYQGKGEYRRQSEAKNRDAGGLYTPKSKKYLQFSTNVYSHSSQKQGYIPQIYRYCIACQQAVLDANIQRHQLSCEQLAKVAEYTLQQVLNHLNKKIKGLKQQVKNKSINLKEDDSFSMRKLCENMDKQCDGIFKSGEMSKKFISNYDEAIKIGKRWSQTSEKINRLRWFIKIREQLKKNFNV